MGNTEEAGNYFPSSCILVRGRPRGRNVDSSPSSSDVLAIHVSSPYGVPRLTQWRSALSSRSVCGWFTISTQLVGRGRGHADRIVTGLSARAGQPKLEGQEVRLLAEKRPPTDPTIEHVENHSTGHVSGWSRHPIFLPKLPALVKFGGCHLSFTSLPESWYTSGILMAAQPTGGDE